MMVTMMSVMMIMMMITADNSNIEDEDDVCAATGNTSRFLQDDMNDSSFSDFPLLF